MDKVTPHTLRELHIFSDSQQSNIFKIFDQTKTLGARDILRKLIQTPKESVEEVNKVQDGIEFICTDISKWEISTGRSYISAAELYFSSSISYSMSQDVFKHWVDTFIFSQLHFTEFSKVRSGLSASIQFLQSLHELVERQDSDLLPEILKFEFEKLRPFFKRTTIKSILKTPPHKISNSRIFFLDYYLRIQHRDTFREVIDSYYMLDVYLSIAKTKNKFQLTFPTFIEDGASFSVDGLWLPFIENAVPNGISLSPRQHVCILTGANTSGKTTFLKNCGMAIYLAHLGWPVPARQMKLRFFHKLFTSIHLSDNLDSGLSHFYSEIKRIEEVALAIHEGKNCFVIIDELFRGTNTEDSLNCSRIVIDGFIKHSNSVFLVSTHLFELLEELRKAPPIAFRCFKTTVNDMHFEHTFKIENGVALEKIGGIILEKSGIPALLARSAPH